MVPKSYKMAYIELQMVPNVVLAILTPGYLYLRFVNADSILHSSYTLSPFSKSNFLQEMFPCLSHVQKMT